MEAQIKDEDWESFKMSKRFYKSCMDQDVRDRDGLDAAKKVLDEVFGQWPVVAGENWTETNQVSRYLCSK